MCKEEVGSPTCLVLGSFHSVEWVLVMSQQSCWVWNSNHKLLLPLWITGHLPVCLLPVQKDRAMQCKLLQLFTQETTQKVSSWARTTYAHAYKKGRPYMSRNGHGGRILYTQYARFTCLRVDFRNNSTAPKTFALSDLASKENLSAAAPKTFVPWEQCRRQKTCSYRICTFSTVQILSSSFND